MGVTSGCIQVSHSIDICTENPMGISVGMKTGVLVKEPVSAELAEEFLLRGLGDSVGHFCSLESSVFGEEVLSDVFVGSSVRSDFEEFVEDFGPGSEDLDLV